MTATERVPRIQNDEILSMNDIDDYGNMIYFLSYKNAIEADEPIICDYKIVTVEISEVRIKKLMEENEYHNIYIQNEGAWEKECQNKFGYTGPKKNSLGKRNDDSHEQHSYLKKIVTAFKIFITFYDLGYKEFDEITEQYLSDSFDLSDELDLSNNYEKITVNFKKNDLAGVTLENNYGFLNMNSRGPGVVISKINEYQFCYKCGLRKNDIILFINNIPCSDHKQAVDIINGCCSANIKMTCELLKYKTKS